VAEGRPRAALIDDDPNLGADVALVLSTPPRGRESDERDPGHRRPREAVEEEVVAGGGHGDDHQRGVHGEEDAGETRTRHPIADDRHEDAPADVHARHRRVGIEPDPHERPGVVAREPDRVPDPEPGNEPRRRRREGDEHDRRERDRAEQQVSQLPVAGGVPGAEPDRRRRDHRAEPQDVAGGQEAGNGGNRVLERRFAEHPGRPLEGDHVARMRDGLGGRTDRQAPHGQVAPVHPGPEADLGSDEAQPGSLADPPRYGRGHLRIVLARASRA
jgi:hypothetical protein